MAHKIWLMAHDLSPDGDEIARIAAKELGQAGRLVILHIYELPAPPAFFSSIGTETPFTSAQELGDAMSAQFRQRVDGLAQELKEQYPSLEIESVVRQGDAVDEILRVCYEKQVDRIVIGTHGRRGVEYLLLGSVAQKVVRLSPVSVLVVKPGAHRGVE